MKKLIVFIIGIYIFSCSGEHATEEGSETTDSSAVVKEDSIPGDTTFIEVDLTRP